MPVLAVERDDQYLVATADTPLLAIWEATPEGLYPPVPPAELPGGLGGLLVRGGFGQNFFFPADVLGLTFRTPKGRVVKAGGRVIKNVQGYDLVRPFIGSFGLLGEPLEAVLRLRPAAHVELFVGQGELAEVAPLFRFVWQEKDRIYGLFAGYPARLAELEGFTPANFPDYRDLFPQGMGVGEEGPLRDLRFTWADGGQAPPVPAPFRRLAEAL